ncbi:19701_t:CDS:2 [Dentiscutata erythropus]|uniref:19701_t:CDS:1 n=1 Tax=Dentiscutata erythropus TaxID=1348616 RepID=A0A9N9D1T2_9GLOM|nr:19701_t:CDS:2 [Dentiscutata erythropus]
MIIKFSISSKYFLGITLLNLIFENLVNAQIPPTDSPTNSPTKPPTDLYEDDPAGFLSVVIIGFIFAFLALAGIFFVLNRIYYRWTHKHKSLSMALRVRLAIYHTSFSDQVCKSVAAVSVTFTLIHRLTIAGISIITYMRVCQQKICDTGRYDWKIFLPTTIISVILSIMSLPTYGSNIYWCAAKAETIMVPIFSIFLTFFVLSICLFCYVQTIRSIRDIKKQQSKIVENRARNSSYKAPIEEVEIKVSVKVLGYILVYMIQWIPAIPYDIYSLLGHTRPWVYCMVTVAVNMGSIGNAIFYVINEGWTRHGNSNSSLSYEQVNLKDMSGSKSGSKDGGTSSVEV